MGHLRRLTPTKGGVRIGNDPVTIDSPLIARLKRSEGLRLHAYLDSTGNLTIGYGHNLGRLKLPFGVKLSDIHLEPVNGITKEMAEELLYLDVAIADSAVSHERKAEGLDPIRREVLVELCFNIGPKVLTYPVFMDQLDRARYNEAAENMKGWAWSSQVGPHRSLPLIEMMKTGERQ
jgi:lysozyme